jgi:hypothetical protein
VTIGPELGTYELRLTVDDSALSAFDQLVVSAYFGGTVLSIAQVNYFDTGFSSSGNPLPVPAIDPAGLVYHEPTDQLIIADSEINEVAPAFDIVQANLFATPTTGGITLDQWDTTQTTGVEPSPNREPTGITYCAGDGHFYVSNDDSRYIYRYACDGVAFTAVEAVATVGASDDPEGVTCDPASGLIYVIGGLDKNILVYSYNSGFVLEIVIDIAKTAGDPESIPVDAEASPLIPAADTCSRSRTRTIRFSSTIPPVFLSPSLASVISFPNRLAPGVSVSGLPHPNPGAVAVNWLRDRSDALKYHSAGRVKTVEISVTLVERNPSQKKDIYYDGRNVRYDRWQSFVADGAVLRARAAYQPHARLVGATVGSSEKSTV